MKHLSRLKRQLVGHEHRFASQREELNDASHHVHVTLVGDVSMDYGLADPVDDL